MGLLVSFPVSETPVAIECLSSQRIIITASVLFVLVLSPVESQTPSPSPTPSLRINSRVNRINSPPAEETASPGSPLRSHPGNALDRYVLRSPTPTVTPNVPPIPEIEMMRRLAMTAKLTATPTSIAVNDSVQFELVFPTTAPINPYIRYVFDFGDTSRPESASKPFTSHQYSLIGRHQPSAQIFVRDTVVGQNIRGTEINVRPRLGPTASATTSAPTRPPARSPSPTPSATASVPTTPSRYSPLPTANAPSGFITPTPSSSSPNVASPTPSRSPLKSRSVTPSPIVSHEGKRLWILYIVTASLAAAALFGILTLIKPTFRLRWNRNEPQRPPENLTINYELRFNSNVSDGQNRITTHGASLIQKRRKQ